MNKTNIILVGMPGAGKSTVGVILAKRIGFQFVDTDLLIQTQEQCRLQQIIDKQGLQKFRAIEEQVLLTQDTQHCVIATGGSAIYSTAGMRALRKNGYIIYIDVQLSILSQRIANMGQRGLVIDKNQTFDQLFKERTPLYQQHADLSVKTVDLTAEQVAANIETSIKLRWPTLYV